jgi:tRNA A-37 threonylcarbamoyl transferase component Bud32
MNKHPSADQLRQFLAANLPAADQCAVEKHVNQCPKCQQALCVLAECSAGAARPTVFPRQIDAGQQGDAEHRQRFIDRMKKAPPSATPPGSTTSDQESSPGPAAASLVARTLPAAAMRFDLQRIHASGGLGEVWIARDKELDREVALKRMRPEVAGKETSRRRFLREAEITGKLEHPGVVPVYGLVQGDEGQPCYAMRFVEGETLKEAIDRFHAAEQSGRDPGERRLALRQLLSRFVAVCNTLAYAHSRGIIHRDVKPANILLAGRYGETLVVDWGLARPFARTDGERASGEQTLDPSNTADGATQMGQAVGTPAFMSPEQADGRWDVVGPQSDIFSLGATLSALLTGQPPFQGSNQHEVLSKARRSDFPLPRRLKRGVPPALEAVCCKAMANKPQDRYAGALELAADVEHFLADEPVTAYREPWLVRARRWARRHRTLAAAATTAVILAVVVSAGVFIYTQRQAAELRLAVEAGLLRAVELRQQSRWNEAREVLAQTRSRLVNGRPADLRQRLDQESANLTLVGRLDDIRLQAASFPTVGETFDFSAADRAYAETFAQAEMATQGENPALVAARVRDSAVAEQLLAALDDWATVTQSKDCRRWLLAVARKVDPDEQRDRLRDPALWESSGVETATGQGQRGQPVAAAGGGPGSPPPGSGRARRADIDRGAASAPKRLLAGPHAGQRPLSGGEAGGGGWLFSCRRGAAARSIGWTEQPWCRPDRHGPARRGYRILPPSDQDRPKGLLWPTTTWATPWRSKAGWTRPSNTIAKRPGSTRSRPCASATSAPPWEGRAAWPRPSPASARPSSSIGITPLPTPTSAWP